MKKKVFYLIPGLGEKGTELGYKELVVAAKLFGFRVVIIKPDWRVPLMSDLIRRSLRKIDADVKKNKPDHVTIFGFSFGAFIAVIIASKRKLLPIDLILCSLSPYFNEDIEYLPENWKKELGNDRIKDFSKHFFPKGLKINTQIFVGKKEWPLIIKRAKLAYKLFVGKKNLILISGAVHDFNKTNYHHVVINKIFKKSSH